MIKDSVQEIQSECDRLLALCKDTTRIDISVVSEELKECILALKTEYDKDSALDDNRLKILKSGCESEAIRLEYCLVCANMLDTTRYKQRCQVKDIYERFMTLKRTCKKNICDLMTYYNFADSIYNESKHIIFEMSEEQQELLDILKEVIEKCEKNKLS